MDLLFMLIASVNGYLHSGIYEQLVLKQLVFMIMRHRKFYHIEVIRPLNHIKQNASIKIFKVDS